MGAIPIQMSDDYGKIYSETLDAAVNGDMNGVLDGIDKGMIDLHGIALFAAGYGHRDIVFEMIRRGSTNTTPMGLHAIHGGHWQLGLELMIMSPFKSLCIVMMPIFLFISFMIHAVDIYSKI